MSVPSPVTSCTFASAGTFGHECGAPATLVGVKLSEHTTTGYYYAGRCARCAQIKGGENAPVLRFEPIDKSEHINFWK